MGSPTILQWRELADAYAFLGNSLLRPMSQTADVGLDPGFWAAFPCFDSDAVADAVDVLLRWAADLEPDREKCVAAVSVEYAALFVGPPSPAAPPWETLNRREGVTVVFGEPTFQMREMLRSLGLEVIGQNNQYEDHLGLELLCLSEMCRRRAQTSKGIEVVCERVRGDDSHGAGAEVSDGLVAAFIDEHPLGWIEVLAGKVEAARPNGYFAHLLALVRALLMRHRACLT